jgi:hypothetical protein
MVMLFKSCSVKDATRICIKFFCDILDEIFQSSPQQEICFPVIVGEYCGRIVPQFVNDAFVKIRSNFAVCYCVHFYFSQGNHCIIYKFAIQRKADSLPDDDLQNLVQKQAEEVVTGVMQSYDCWQNAEPLTVVELRDKELLIAFARTPKGMQEIEKTKTRIRVRQLRQQVNVHAEQLKEDWTDGKK